uniref:Uncharacterized protein n=1 Tax=Eutreptiella gymnastica TaxID=73025 RepID=A0A7S4GHK7_9EUGL
MCKYAKALHDICIPRPPQPMKRLPDRRLLPTQAARPWVAGRNGARRTVGGALRAQARLHQRIDVPTELTDGGQGKGRGNNRRARSRWGQPWHVNTDRNTWARGVP